MKIIKKNKCRNCGKGISRQAIRCKSCSNHNRKNKYKISEFTKRKISKANKGKKRSQEVKEKLSKSHKGKKLSKETREKIRKAQLGKKHTEKTKEKISKIQKGRFKGNNHPNWKGGVISKSSGYILIKKSSHPYCDSQGYIFRSHLVMEQMIGHYLKPGEIVHHKNSITGDDRPENLKLFANQSAHQKFHQEGKRLAKQIARFERWQEEYKRSGGGG